MVSASRKQNTGLGQCVVIHVSSIEMGYILAELWLSMTSTFLLPPGDNGERLRAKVTRKVVEDIEQADGERVQKLSFILGIGNGKFGRDHIL